MTNMTDDEFYRAIILYSISNLESFVIMMKRSGQIDPGPTTWVHVMGFAETYHFITRSDI